MEGTGLFIRCLTCGEEAPCENMSDWGRFIRHGGEPGHKSRLFDVETREELASSPVHVSRIIKERTGDTVSEPTDDKFQTPQFQTVINEDGVVPHEFQVIDNDEGYEQLGETVEDIELAREQLQALIDKNQIGLRPSNLLEDQDEDEERTQGILQRGGSALSPEGMIQHQITLPPEAYVMYNLAQAWGLSGEAKKNQNLNEWIFDCIRIRYELDYGLELCLSRVVDGDGNIQPSSVLPSIPVSV